MSEAEKEQGGVESDQAPIRVNDRRRFDKDGNVRSEAPAPQSGEEAPSDAPRSSAPPVEDAESVQLRGELEAARKRVDELARAFQALSNDREEFKQRLARERDRMLEVEKGHVALILLEVLDELDLSLEASDKDDSPLARGVRLIRDGILSRVQAMGIERFDLAGQIFDPNLAEASDVEITTVPADDQKVVSVIRAGYRLKERVIRPARVKVAKYVAPAEA